MGISHKLIKLSNKSILTEDKILCNWYIKGLLAHGPYSHTFFCNNEKTMGFRGLVSTEVVYKCMVSDIFKHKISSVAVADYYI